MGKANSNDKAYDFVFVTRLNKINHYVNLEESVNSITSVLLALKIKQKILGKRCNRQKENNF